MHTVDIILKRRSVRKFKKDLVPWDNIVSMVNCAINAPVAGNIFNSKFIIVQDPANRRSIADACYNQAWIAQAPVVIVITAEPGHQERFYGTRGSKLYTIQNCAACAMSMIIGAESLGLSTCWISSFEEDRLRDICGLPEEVNIHIVLAVGFSDEKPDKPPKPNPKTVVYLEKFWAGRKLPGYGFYSENIMKFTKNAVNGVQKLGKKLAERGKK